ATFLYALAAIAWVDRGGTGKVPLITLLVAIVLVLASVVFFVMLVDKLALLQISRVLAYVGAQGRAVIERDYAPLDTAGAAEQGSAELSGASVTVPHPGGPALVQALD